MRFAASVTALGPGVGLGVVLILGLAGRAPECRGAEPADSGALDHFERHVRPLLVERCQGCHGAGKQFAGLRLDGPEDARLWRALEEVAMARGRVIGSPRTIRPPSTLHTGAR